ncbi:hypothetical protein Bhyg_04320 [Pseudolycoriella hygida]|uniref:Jacalin-type lectin domain-containing protein n=1 Tax=Pseudolycoriella hygida TaxID=35572 RepID=A0A9Q0S8B7_9DIPT|nr:hypothetical protein Bhyg_04320 [Pseudolycoriella hygida]
MPKVKGHGGNRAPEPLQKRRNDFVGPGGSSGVELAIGNLADVGNRLGEIVNKDKKLKLDDENKMASDAMDGREMDYQAAFYHGGYGGLENTLQCPSGGAITRVNFRSGNKVDQLEFVCTSSVGKSTIGPYGENGGHVGSLNCPEGHYVSSFIGRSGLKLDRFGIRCRPENDMNSEGVIVGQFGGWGGAAFDELAFSIGYRPISIKIRSGDVIDGLQVTYGNTPISGKLCTSCNNYKEVWAPQHVWIKFNLFVLHLWEKLPLVLGVAMVGLLAKNRVAQLGIRCSRVGQAGGSPKRDGHGGLGGHPFDDESYSSNYGRPIQIRIRASNRVNAIQIKYGNLPVALNCKVTKVAVTDSNIMAQDDGSEVIGLASGSTCSNQVQQLTVSKESSVTETVGVETQEGGEFNWASTLSFSFTTGVNIGAKSEITVGLSQTFGGSHSWSHTSQKSTSTESGGSLGTQVSYQGPGAAIVVGFMTRYKIERDSLPVLYHFTCEAGSLAPKTGTINLNSKSYGKANFEDYYHTFPDTAACTSKSRRCVAAINANSVSASPSRIEENFNKCFV